MSKLLRTPYGEHNSAHRFAIRTESRRLLHAPTPPTAQASDPMIEDCEAWAFFDWAARSEEQELDRVCNPLAPGLGLGYVTADCIVHKVLVVYFERKEKNKNSIPSSECGSYK